VQDVFVSYSRRDTEFVRQLVEGLHARGKEVWLDTEGIRDGEVFPAAIRSAVEGSKAFVLVISPDSVASPFCDQEVDHALEHHKQIVPLAYRPVADGELPEPIRVLAGRAKLTVPNMSGREVIVAVRGPGDLLGELAALVEAPRSATVGTIEPVDALIVSGSAFAAFLDRNSRVALVILRLVAERLLYADLQQAQFATHDVVGRVAHRLVELTDRFGVETEDGIVLDMPLSQEELAGWTGASREAVNKALQVLRSLHMIETGRRRLTVLDADGLRRMAG
jgi:CRP/FNR family transcriptional regulator, cyclic AMP receptor protein